MRAILLHFYVLCPTLKIFPAKYGFVPITRMELKEYLRPALSRRSFRFSRLRGLVRDDTLRSLRFANAFSRPMPAPESSNGRTDRGANLMRGLSKAGETLRIPIMEALIGLSGAAGPDGRINNEARMEAMRRIEGILRECGVHSAFGRNMSAGLMLHDAEFAGVPLRVYLGESYGASLGRGRLNLSPNGACSLEIDLTQTAARLVQILDYYLANPVKPPPHLDSLRLSLIRAPKERLITALGSRMEGGRIPPEGMPVLFALDVSCLRLANDSLDCLLAENGSPRDFMLHALNMCAGNVLAHETAHLQESRASGALVLRPIVRETIAYLLQAVHCDPADAFRSMMLRGFDISMIMPNFDAAIRSMGPHAFCLERAYLRGWARGMLEGLLEQIRAATGREIRIDAAPIVHAQDICPVQKCDMPFVERALCNPNLRVDSALIRLPEPESG